MGIGFVTPDTESSSDLTILLCKPELLFPDVDLQISAMEWQQAKQSESGFWAFSAHMYPVLSF